MDNLTKQSEEIEALAAIYGKEFEIEDEENRAYSIEIVNSNDSNLWLKLYIKLPDTYPAFSPPTFEISAPYLKQSEKKRLGHLLQSIYQDHIGQNVIFQWIESIREELHSEFSELKDIEPETGEPKEPVIYTENASICPTITHGEIILDRKSSFQGHTAVVSSVNEVRQVINKLKENRKIQQAKHNMHAFRIYNKDTKSFIHDCDDDGEHQAGSRLLHLLEIMNAKNVIVIVSRWYGGIHLGSDRFRHINNAARQVLAAANLIPNSQK